MNIIQDFIPAGRKNRPGKQNPMKYITIHNTGNTSKGSGAKSHSSYIKSDTAASLPVSWHYTVDEFGAYQHLPDNETAYHAGDGSGSGNKQSIGIEVCMNSDGDLLKATDNTVELVALLILRHNISITNIVQHNHWSGKNCPQMLRSGKPYSWEIFINKIYEYLNSKPSQPPAPSFSPYLVRITDSALNIRSEPSVSSSIVGVIKDRGVYTIIEEKSGWGRLKSGVGWISLTYTKKQ